MPRMCSSRIGSREDTNFASLPVVTLEAPMISTGRCGLAPHSGGDLVEVDIPAAATPGKSVKLRRVPSVMNDIIVCISGEEGLSWKDREGASVDQAHRIDDELVEGVSSFHPWAMLSFQKSIMRFQTGCSPFRSAYHASAAHTAPPEVPLTPTTSRRADRHLRLNQSLQRPGGKSRLAPAALAGDRDLEPGHRFPSSIEPRHATATR